MPVVLPHQGEGLAEHGQHAEAEEVHLEDAQRVQVVLLPLDDGAVLHRGVLHRHHLGQLAVGDDEAAHVDGEVAGEALQQLGQRERPLHARVLGTEPRLRHLRVGQGAAPRHLGALGEPVHLVQRQPQRLPHLADGQPPAVADDLAHHAGAIPAVLAVDVLEHLLATLVLEVHVDVRRLGTLEAEEALEEQPHPHRVDGGDAQRVADRGVGRAPPPLAEDAVAEGEVDDVLEGEEVAGHLQLLDELELVLDLLAHRPGDAGRVAEVEPLLHQVTRASSGWCGPAEGLPGGTGSGARRARSGSCRRSPACGPPPRARPTRAGASPPDPSASARRWGTASGRRGPPGSGGGWRPACPAVAAGHERGCARRCGRRAAARASGPGRGPAPSAHRPRRTACDRRRRRSAPGRPRRAAPPARARRGTAAAR